MRTSLLFVFMASAVIASEAAAAAWAPIIPRDKEASFWYQPASPYIETKTGRVHVSVCTMTPECVKFAASGDDGADNVNVTDAVIDCKRKTVVWSDFMELSHTYRLTGKPNGRPLSIQAQMKAQKGDERKISPRSDLGILITRYCARTAALPRRAAEAAAQ